ncbi:MAG TPA: hypothetical protein VJY35_09290 [Candidatus Eisenbacteria bacterium]|nr:hypothetical protein [Candidatus Eisenbacteria bacterium]
MPLRPPATPTRWIAALLVVGLAAAHIRMLAFLCDDAFIAFRYARSWAEGFGPVFNVGERVEGYTDFLWVAVLASVLKLGGTLEFWAPRLGAAAALATLVVLMVALERRTPWSGILAGTLLGASASWAAWATGGLETALFTLLVTVAFLQSLEVLAGGGTRAAAASGACLALAAMTRPDGLLFAGATFVVLAAQAARGRLPWRSVWVWCALLAALFGPYFAWRWAYYGQLLPHTFAVKVGGAAMLGPGIAYLGAAAARLHPELLLIPGAALLALRLPAGVSRSELAMWSAWVLPFTAYVAWVGGDFMDLFRFLAPLVPLLAWIAARGSASLAETLERRVRAGRIVAAAVALLVLAGWTAINLRASSESTEAWNRQGLDSIGLLRQYAADWTLIGLFFATVAQPSDTLATSAAGIIPYYSRLHTIDELGLVARDLSQYRRLDSPRSGHALSITGQALLEARPQYLVSHPVVAASPGALPVGISVEPGWGARFAEHYQGLTVSLSETPPRFFSFVARRDVAAKLRQGP